MYQVPPYYAFVLDHCIPVQASMHCCKCPAWILGMDLPQTILIGLREPLGRKLRFKVRIMGISHRKLHICI